MPPICTHADHVRITELPESVDGCDDCLAMGSLWLAPAHLPGVRPRRLLRRLAQQARHRARGSTGHPIIRSLEPGEDWCWCFVDQVGMLIPDVHGRTQIPPSPLLG